tara:strand:+ start:868 stop:1665 length:798 start_codon:yes stop_codon:yes gene_type:complete
MIYNEKSRVIDNKEIAENIFEAHLSSENLSKIAKPGQFINILPSSDFDKTMRRPMSLSYQDDKSFKIIYKPIGDGTRIMRDWKKDDSIDVLGPLGNSWDTSSGKEAVLLGGGVGIAPILNLYNSIKATKTAHLFFGARKKNEHFINHNPDENIYISTDDGSAGIKGNLFEAMKSIFDISVLQDKSIYVCGPPMMMEAVRKFSVEHNIECHLALETIMACGIGICQGCTVEKCSSNTYSDTYRNKYELVCMDGPIYKANEVKTCLL